MDTPIFPFSPALEAEDPVMGPKELDPMFRCDRSEMEEKKAREIAEANNENLAEAVKKFAQGFDVATLEQEVREMLPKFRENLFPGSYSHLMLILFEEFDELQNIQASLCHWLQRYKWTPVPVSEPKILDETMFGSEMEMLRKLLSPLRGEESKVYWVNTRLQDAALVCNQVEASMNIIKVFKHDLLNAVEEDNQSKTIYNPLPVSQARMSAMSSRQIRLDSCKCTLAWDTIIKEGIEHTNFFQNYKRHTCETQPDKARKYRWLPPTSPDIPRSSPSEMDADCLSYWPVEGPNNEILTFMLKVALWLGLARGLSPVHLFCEMVNCFSPFEPPEQPSDSYMTLLCHMTNLRVSIEGISSRVQTPVPYRDKFLFENNPDFYMDVSESNKIMMEDLMEKVSRVQIDNIENFNLTMPPSRSRKSRGMDTPNSQLPSIHGSLAGEPFDSDSLPAPPKEKETDLTDPDLPKPSSPVPIPKRAAELARTLYGGIDDDKTYVDILSLYEDELQ